MKNEIIALLLYVVAFTLFICYIKFYMISCIKPFIRRLTVKCNGFPSWKSGSAKSFCFGQIRRCLLSIGFMCGKEKMSLKYNDPSIDSFVRRFAVSADIPATAESTFQCQKNSTNRMRCLVNIQLLKSWILKSESLVCLCWGATKHDLPEVNDA